MRLVIRILEQFLLIAFLLGPNIPAIHVWLIVLIIISILHTFLIYHTLSNRYFTGKVTLRRKFRPTSYVSILVIFIVLFAFFVAMEVDRGKTYLLYLSIFTINEIVEQRLKDILDFDALLIDGSYLKINRISLVDRNLITLKKISAIDLGDLLVFKFDGSKAVYIERSHYPKDALWEIIEKATSFNDVEVTPGVLEKFNQR